MWSNHSLEKKKKKKCRVEWNQWMAIHCTWIYMCTENFLRSRRKKKIGKKNCVYCVVYTYFCIGISQWYIYTKLNSYCRVYVCVWWINGYILIYLCISIIWFINYIQLYSKLEFFPSSSVYTISLICVSAKKFIHRPYPPHDKCFSDDKYCIGCIVYITEWNFNEIWTTQIVRQTIFFPVQMCSLWDGTPRSVHIFLVFLLLFLFSFAHRWWCCNRFCLIQKVLLFGYRDRNC